MQIPDEYQVPTQVACPEWCTQPPGHPYVLYIADDLRRFHIRQIRSAGLTIELSQLEEALTADGPVVLEQIEVCLYADDSVTMTPKTLLETARALGDAANRLEELTSGSTDVAS